MPQAVVFVLLQDRSRVVVFVLVEPVPGVVLEGIGLPGAPTGAERLRGKRHVAGWVVGRVGIDRGRREARQLIDGVVDAVLIEVPRGSDIRVPFLELRPIAKLVERPLLLEVATVERAADDAID